MTHRWTVTHELSARKVQTQRHLTMQTLTLTLAGGKEGRVARASPPPPPPPPRPLRPLRRPRYVGTGEAGVAGRQQGEWTDSIAK